MEKTEDKKTENRIIVAFHIGRGGRFNNAGHLSFIGEKRIGEFTDDLFLNYENIGKFKNRLGFDTTTIFDRNKCIVNCINDEDFDTLEELYGITKEMLGERRHYTSGGHDVGLTLSEEDSGVGTIDKDGKYDTVYSKYADELTEAEIEAIKDSNVYKSTDLSRIIGEEVDAD